MSDAAPKRGKKKRRQPEPEADPEFQIAPMIDILLVLLVFFMSITTAEILKVNKGVTLPVAKDAKDREKPTGGEILVNVLWNPLNDVGGIEISEQKFDQADQIVPLLTKAVAAAPETRILIRADRRVRYDYLRSIMLVAGKAGVGKVTFSVVDKEDGSAPPAPAPGTPP